MDSLPYLDSYSGLLLTCLQNYLCEPLYNYFLKVFEHAIHISKKQFEQDLSRSAKQNSNNNSNNLPNSEQNARKFNNLVFTHFHNLLQQVKRNEYQLGEQEKFMNYILNLSPIISAIPGALLTQVFYSCACAKGQPELIKTIDFNSIINIRRVVIESIQWAAKGFESNPTVLDKRASFDQQRDRKLVSEVVIKNAITKTLLFMLPLKEILMWTNKLPGIIPSGQNMSQNTNMNPLVAPVDARFQQFAPQMTMSNNHGPNMNNNPNIINPNMNNNHNMNTRPMLQPPQQGANLFHPQPRGPMLDPQSTGVIHARYLPEDDFPDDDDDENDMDQYIPFVPGALSAPASPNNRVYARNSDTPIPKEMYPAYQYNCNAQRAPMLPRPPVNQQNQQFTQNLLPIKPPQNVVNSQSANESRNNNVDRLQQDLSTMKQREQELEQRLQSIQNEEKERALQLQQHIADQNKQFEQKLQQMDQRQQEQQQRQREQQEKQERQLQDERKKMEDDARKRQYEMQQMISSQQQQKQQQDNIRQNSQAATNKDKRQAPPIFDFLSGNNHDSTQLKEYQDPDTPKAEIVENKANNNNFTSLYELQQQQNQKESDHNDGDAGLNDANSPQNDADVVVNEPNSPSSEEASAASSPTSSINPNAASGMPEFDLLT